MTLINTSRCLSNTAFQVHSLTELIAHLCQFQPLVLLGLLAVLWGSTTVTIKIAVAEIPPMTLTFGRLALGAFLLYLMLYVQHRKLPARGVIWIHLTIAAMFHSVTPYILLNWGMQYIDSALAAVLAGITPLATILLAHILIADDRLTRTKVLGVLVGLIGLFILIAPALLLGIQASLAGLLAVALAEVFFGVAYGYTRKYLNGLPGLTAATSQLILAAILALPFSLIFDKPFTLAPPSWTAMGALLAIGVLSTALAYFVYYQLAGMMNPSHISMVSYLIPVVGVVLGVVILDERLAWNSYIGGGIILMGVMIINGIFSHLPRHQIRHYWIRYGPAH